MHCLISYSYTGKKVKNITHQNIEYTCPMHPQIRQMGPGNCPICGMTLAPVEVQKGEADDSEYLLMRKRFLISALLSLHLLQWVVGISFIKRACSKI
jgi:Cu+-exporting ATPase